MEEVMERSARAKLSYARISSRKVKVVIDLIRNKPVGEALAILKFTPKAAAELVEKLLNSAIANAENNHEMDVEKLYVAEVYANQGPTLKRIRPRAQGRAPDSETHQPHHGRTEGKRIRKRRELFWVKRYTRMGFALALSKTGIPDGTLTRNISETIL